MNTLLPPVDAVAIMFRNKVNFSVVDPYTAPFVRSTFKITPSAFVFGVCVYLNNSPSSTPATPELMSDAVLLNFSVEADKY